MKPVLAILALASFAHAGTLVLIPIQDAYICDCQPDVTNPNGGPSHLYHGRYTTCYDRSLIQWDLSSIPAGATVESAVMRLYCISFTGTPSGQPAYYLIDEAWDELTVTHNTDPGHLATPVITASWPQPQTWFEVEVTSFVQGWMAGEHPNFGIYCTSTGCVSTSVPGFWSKDSDHEDLRPQLVVTYSLAGLSESTWGAIKTE
jgi:hypothetical protein